MAGIFCYSTVLISFLIDCWECTRQPTPAEISFLKHVSTATRNSVCQCRHLVNCRLP